MKMPSKATSVKWKAASAFLKMMAQVVMKAASATQIHRVLIAWKHGNGFTAQCVDGEPLINKE